MASTPPPDSPSENHPLPEGSLADIRAILLREERERIERLSAEKSALEAEIERLQAQLAKMESDHSAEITHLHQQLSDTDTELKSAIDSIVPRVQQAIDDILEERNRATPDDMAEAMGPIMAESTRVQIRESRDDMVDALYPIIGETVQEAVRSSIKEFQRNIDARLRGTRPRSPQQTMEARLKGVSSAELAMRSALPFAIKEAFLIQPETGLPMAHVAADEQGSLDSDLISGMLTAIRDFVRDSFNSDDPNEELEEINYGDQIIALESGSDAYLALVYEGIEPEGFNATLRSFMTDLHVDHGRALRKYDGDPDTVSAVIPEVEALVGRLNSGELAADAPKPFTAGQKLLLLIGLLAVLFMLGCFCLSSVRLVPLLYPELFAQPPTPTLSPTATPTPLPTATPQPSPTLAPSVTPTETPSPTPTSTQTPTATAEPSATPSPSPRLLTNTQVWVHAGPAIESEQLAVLLPDTEVELLSVDGLWGEISYANEDGSTGDGWVGLRWLTFEGSLPPLLATATAESLP